MPIDARPDHVAIAVHDLEAASARWQEQLGGVWLSPRFSGGGFGTRQLRYSNLAKLELLEPEVQDGFAAAFLDRFGPRVHHVTLKVPDLLDAVRTVEAAGYDVVDVSTARDEWHEGFLRPSQVGGLIVQIARPQHDDEGWARLAGMDLPPVDPDSPALLGPTLTAPDLEASAQLWATLGARIDEDGDDAFEARWGDEPLTVRVEREETAGPRGLRFDPDPRLPADDVVGPGTLPG
ncbi:MAG: VOC family protein [Nitriliruptor sp.]|uniref:VOC family protein n=1 Tax=Nitriliruptor sp. TaxID=2448056 RepID=UPI0034A0A336